MESLFGLHNPHSTFNSNNIEGAIASLSLSGKRNFTRQDFKEWLLIRANEYTTSEDNELISGIPGDDYNYSKALFNEWEQKLELETDFFALRSLYYLKLPHAFAFCSEIEPLIALARESLSINRKAIAYFIQHGITPQEDTFFNEISLIPANHVLTYQSEKITLKHKDNPFLEIEKPNDALVLETLKDSHQKWIDQYSVQAANLSAGADTRLLLSLLEEKERHNFTFYVDASPYLKEDNDKDVIGAKLLAKKFNLNLKVQTHVPVSIKSNNYFERSNPPSVPKVSGNHGGEILGADVFSALHFLLNKSSDEADDHFINELMNERPTKVVIPSNFKEKYQWAIKKLFNPFFTDIYGGGSLNHWSMPHRFALRKIAPFWSNKLIYLLSLLDKDELINYELYKKIYLNYAPEFAEVPFFSPIANQKPPFCLIETGINQKETLKKDTLEEIFERVCPHPDTTSLFDTITLKENLVTQPTMTKRTLKVIMWLKDVFPQGL